MLLFGSFNASTENNSTLAVCDGKEVQVFSQKTRDLVNVINSSSAVFENPYSSHFYDS